MTLTGNRIAETFDSLIKKAWADIVPALPEAPANGECHTCHNKDFYYFEAGYDRMSSLEYTDGGWHAWTKGWDDISEIGVTQMIICQNCDAAYKIPETIDISWN